MATTVLSRAGIVANCAVAPKAEASRLSSSVSFAAPLKAFKVALRANTSSSTFSASSATICRATAQIGEDVETGFAAPAATKLYIGNLPFNVDSESLAELFQEAGIVELVEVVYDRDTGRSRGFGFVTMRTPEEAQSAIEKFDGSDLGGRTLKVNVPTPKGERPPRTERPARGAPRTGGRGGSDNKIFVGNLSWGMDDMALEDLFSEFGKVLEAKVILDRETGRSRGFGFVTYSTAAEVEEAVSNLNGADVDGRQLRVGPADAK